MIKDLLRESSSVGTSSSSGLSAERERIRKTYMSHLHTKRMFNLLYIIIEMVVQWSPFSVKLGLLQTDPWW